MMRWWLLLSAKALLVLALHLGGILVMNRVFPGDTLGLDLQYSFWIFALDMALFVLGYFLWMDQRYRCRTCLRRLRSPIATGSFGKATIFHPPQLEWICLYGHGTMAEPTAPLSSPRSMHWQAHDENFWRAFDAAWKRD
jgi:hypothetical protein